MFESFKAYDGTIINNESELNDWLEKNNKRQVQESVEELEKKEKITRERQEKEEFEKAKKEVRRLNNSNLSEKLSRKHKDRSIKSNINLRGIRNKDKKIRSLTKFESTRTF